MSVYILLVYILNAVSKVYKLAYINKFILELFFYWKFFYHYIRQCNIITIHYSTNKNISYNNNNFYSNNFFLNKLNKFKVYLEFGSGNSTLVADGKRKIILSVEGDRNFFYHIKKN
jgi:hypothetical protein